MSEVSHLRPLGPLGMIDRALELARSSGGAFWLRGWATGILIGAPVVFVYYLERVEGIRSLRPLLAVGIAAAWCARAIFLSRLSRGACIRLWSDLRPEPEAGNAASVLRVALVTGCGLGIWLLPIVLALRASPIVVAFVLPILALRGATAPSWLARVSCVAGTGVSGFYGAVSENRTRRGRGIAIELLMLLAVIAVAANLFGVVAILLMLLRSMLGIDVALVESFVSLDNDFALLIVGVIALSLFEPLRAALSAVMHVDARVRADGIDLRALVARGIGATQGVAAAAIVFCALVATTTAFAQADGGEKVSLEDAAAPPEPLPSVELLPLPQGTGPDGVDQEAQEGVWDPTASGMPPKRPQEPSEELFKAARELNESAAPQVEDFVAQTAAQKIVDRPEYREFAEHRSASLLDFVDRWFEEIADWFGGDDQRWDAPRTPGASLPSASVFLVFVGILFLGVLVFAFVSLRRGRKAVPEAQSVANTGEVAASAHLAEAARSATTGDYREALRFLYLATLTALDRQRLIEFDPSRTNGYYLRQMTAGDRRALFGDFTRLFDRKWYGDEPIREDEFRHGQALAEQICASTEVP